MLTEHIPYNIGIAKFLQYFSDVFLMLNMILDWQRSFFDVTQPVVAKISGPGPITDGIVKYDVCRVFWSSSYRKDKTKCKQTFPHNLESFVGQET